MEPTISLRDADPHVPGVGLCLPPSWILLLGKPVRIPYGKVTAELVGRQGEMGCSYFILFFLGENFFRRGSATGWLRGQAGVWSPLPTPPSLPEPAREEVHRSECTCLCFRLGLAPGPAPIAVRAAPAVGVQAAAGLPPTPVALRLCPAIGSRPAGSSRCCESAKDASSNTS